MKFSASLSALLISAALLTAPAFAADDDIDVDVEAGTLCYPAKDIIKMTDKFKKLKPGKRDTVAAFASLKMKIEEGEALPTKVFFRDGDMQSAFKMAPSGNVVDFYRIADMNKSGDLCIEDKAKITSKDGEFKFGMSMDIDVIYKNTSGTHGVDEIEDGLKDGKSHIAKMVPAPIRLVLPKFDHVAVIYIDENNEPVETVPQIIARSAAGDKLLTSELYDDMHVVSFEAIKAAGADELVVKGGEYVLAPVPSIEKLKKFDDED